MIQLVCAFGALQLALIAAAFGFGRSRPKRYLAMLAADLAIVIAGAAVMETPLIAANPHLARVHIPFNFGIAPLFYFVALAVVNQKMQRRAWLHAIPAVICAISLMPFYAMPGAEKLQELAHPDATTRVRLVALLIQGAVYIAISFRVIAPYREQQRTLWLATSTFAALWAVCILRLTGAISPLLIPAGFSGCAAVVIISALRSHEAQRAKYARSTLSQPESDRTLERLIKFFDDERPYLRADLSLESVAARLSLSPNHISQVVNQREGRNFNDWVNAYRVAEAQRLLTDQRSAHLSIAGIGDAAGFGAKSTFNASFKKIAGMTPSEFRKRRPKS